jgi:hypothetical protein
VNSATLTTSSAIARAQLKIPVFSGEVELELQGDAVTLRFNGLEARGALPQLRALCERVGLLDKDYLALKEGLRSLGLKVPEPPVPGDLAQLLPACSPPEALELLSTLPHGDLGLNALLERAELEGWVSAEDSSNPKKLLSKVPSHVRARLAAQLLEEWGLVRIVALRLSPAGEERATGEAYESRCAPVGDRVLLPLEVWESAASRFFASALNREALSYVRNHPTALHSVEVPLERVNPWHLLRLKGWVLDLRDLSLAPPSLCDWWFTYQIDLGLSDAKLRGLVERVRRGDCDLKENRVYQLWSGHFPGEEWDYVCDLLGAIPSPRRHRLLGVVVGPPGVGKSSFLTAATKAVDPLIGHVPLAELAAERFAKQPLIGKWANVYSENIAPVLRNPGIVNNLLGEDDWVYVQRKHKPAIYVRALKVMIFACNALPVVKTWSGGELEALLDRLSVVLMEAPEGFKPVGEAASLVSKPDSFEFLLCCAKGLAERGWVPRRRDREEVRKMLVESLNPAYQFVAERCAVNPQARVERKKLYEAYSRWCAERGVTEKMTEHDLYRALRDMGFSDREVSGTWYFYGLKLLEGARGERKQAQLLEEVSRFAETA